MIFIEDLSLRPFAKASTTPIDRSRWLEVDVVHYAVDAFHLVDDARGGNDHHRFRSFFAGLLVRFGLAGGRFRVTVRDGNRSPTMRSPDLIPMTGGRRWIFAAVSFRNSLMVM